MNNLIKSKAGRELLKGALTVGASVTSGTTVVVAQAIAVSLGIAIEYFGELGSKRSKELFDTDILINAILEKISKSDDFASLVFDIWQKYNLESSITRRKMLKALLEKEVNRPVNSFENFSKIEFLIQNMNLGTLKLLKFFNTTVYKDRDYLSEGQDLPTIKDIINAAQKYHFNMPESDIEYRMNDLASNGLVAPLHGRMNGTFYNHATLGFLLLEYISDTVE